MKKKLTLIITASLLAVIVGKAQTIDLAGPKNVTTPIDISNNKKTLTLKNMLIKEGVTYSYKVDLKEEKIPALPISLLESGSAECLQTYSNARNALKNASDEKDVPYLITNLNKQIPLLSSETCINEGNFLISKTSEELDLNFALRYNQTITITIIRALNKDTATWTHVYKTPTKSPWSIMYGFTYIPNMMNPVANYFSKADTSGKSYTITRLNNQKNYFLNNISPTIMITGKPLTTYQWKRKGGSNNLKSFVSNDFYQFGIVGGFSLNFASDAVNASTLAGVSLIIWEYFSFNVGIAMTQKNSLKGQYQEGDIIKDNLDFSQLHEKKCMAEWFFSLSFSLPQQFRKVGTADNKKTLAN